ncbi:MAG: sulfotransferase domain-containing protein [Chloroflexi bacterium]|nr:sulfotransferase domain-containing protein [Chloroflexota bacterium]MBI3169515.1 sulfotransferase domain-containing protein [Chloroflexota bacterium]
MIVLSVGMPRAGSGWHYNLIHDLMKTTGCADARDIREKYKLQKVLTEVNCNIGVLSARRLGMVTVPALMGKTFVIKAHAGPSGASRLLSALGVLRVTYIYRDPRDAMLSAFDYGQRALAKGRPNAFSHLSNFEESVDFMMEYVHIWERWMGEKKVLIARYEDLLTNYEVESTRLVDYLKLDTAKPEVRAVIGQYRPGVNDEQQGLHFYKGKIGRFRDTYSGEQQAIMLKKLKPYLERMGYEE